MYPKLSDLINDLLGTNINLPIQSYGFMLAMAFLAGGLVIYHELKRKENEGLINPQKKKVIKGKPAGINELLFSGVISFLIGFKIIGAIFNYSYFTNDPQGFLFSLEGSTIGGILSAAAYTYYIYWSKQKEKLDKPKEVQVLLHPYQLTGSIIFIAAVSGIIGAKIFHQLENLDDFFADPMGSLFSFSGLTFYGGLIVAAFALVYYAKKNKISWKHIADVVAPALMIAYAIGRIGCHVSGDGDWGIINTAMKPEFLSFLPDWLWAYDYPHNVLNQGVLIEGCTGQYCHHLVPPVFPTPVYETSICSILFLILWFIRKKIKTPGILFSIYLIFNGIERFFIEKIRVNETYNIFGSKITQAEIISVVLILLGSIGIYYFLLANKKKIKRG